MRNTCRFHLATLLWRNAKNLYPHSDAETSDEQKSEIFLNLTTPLSNDPQIFFKKIIIESNLQSYQYSMQIFELW